MELTKVEGIVLHSIPFKEYDKILTLFTPSHGILKIFAKGGRAKSMQQHPYVTPLARGEYLLAVKKQGLASLHDATLISYPYALRESLPCLEASVKMSQALLSSQWEGKAAPRIFFLFCYFLERLSESQTPETLASTFLLKILSHEGLLEEGGRCSLCQTALQESFRFQGERFCKKEAPLEALLFSKEEEQSLSFLMHCTLFSQIASFPLEESFHKKIEVVFSQSINS